MQISATYYRQYQPS